MLTDLSKHFDSNKYNDLSKRLAHVDTKAALAAEAELAVLWAISRVAHITPEPSLPNSKNRPDAASDNLFSSCASVIEVRALSDDSFSGKEAMERTANLIAGFADQLRKDSGRHLYFEFQERSYWNRRFHRERCVDPTFNLTVEIREQIRTWITNPNWPAPEAIRITHGKTDVVVSWKSTTVRHFRTFCTMPAVAYDREKNPIYQAIKSKSSQLKGVTEGTLRCLVLVDAGCSLLRHIKPRGSLGIHEIKGDAIIRHALSKLSIDVVIVLSPYRQRSFVFSHESLMLWNVSIFDRRDNIVESEYDRVRQMVAQLPKPQFEGYQARDIHKQGGFSPDNTWYLDSKTRIQRGGQMTIKLSAALLHEYLAGRIDAETFKAQAFGKDNLFELEFSRGHSIRQLRFESGGLDEDDDYAIFDLDVDWSKIAKKKTGGPNDRRGS